MKAIHSIIAAAALSFGQPMPASAAQSDPEVIIYRFPGVYDDGAAATVFHCTNFSGVTETIRFATRIGSNTGLISNVATFIAHLQTRTAGTTDLVHSYFVDLNLATGSIQGTTAIAATSTNIVCTAMTIDGTVFNKPTGLVLHGIRFNPAPGSQE